MKKAGEQGAGSRGKKPPTSGSQSRGRREVRSWALPKWSNFGVSRLERTGGGALTKGEKEQGGFCPQFHSVWEKRSKGAFAHNSTRFVPKGARGLLPTIPLGLYLSEQGGFCPQFHSVCTFPSKGAFAHNSTRFVPFPARGLLPTIPLGLYLSLCPLPLIKPIDCSELRSLASEVTAEFPSHLDKEQGLGV